MAQFKSESNDKMFALKSNFAKRSSNQTSVAHVPTSIHEADIEKSLQIINSTRRFLQNSSQQAGIDQAALTPTVAMSNEMSHENIIHQSIQMNKSTMDLTVRHQNCVQTTMDGFTHQLTDVSGLKSTKSEMLKFLNDGNLGKLVAEGGGRPPTNSSILNSRLPSHHVCQPNDYVETTPSASQNNESIQENSKKMPSAFETGQAPNHTPIKQPALSMIQAPRAIQNTFMRIEHNNSSNLNTSSVLNADGGCGGAGASSSSQKNTSTLLQQQHYEQQTGGQQNSCTNNTATQEQHILQLKKSQLSSQQQFIGQQQPLRSLTPIIPSSAIGGVNNINCNSEENTSIEAQLRHSSTSELERQIYGTAFISNAGSLVVTSREGHEEATNEITVNQHFEFAPGEALSPSVLDADLEEQRRILQQQNAAARERNRRDEAGGARDDFEGELDNINRDTDRVEDDDAGTQERSQLYETGQQSDAINAVSRAQLSGSQGEAEQLAIQQHQTSSIRVSGNDGVPPSQTMQDQQLMRNSNSINPMNSHHHLSSLVNVEEQKSQQQQDQSLVLSPPQAQFSRIQQDLQDQSSSMIIATIEEAHMSTGPAGLAVEQSDHHLFQAIAQEPRRQSSLNRSYTAQDMLNTSDSLIATEVRPQNHHLEENNALIGNGVADLAASTHLPPFQVADAAIRQNRHYGTQVVIRSSTSTTDNNLVNESQEIGTDVQQKISLRYDKIELEQKLAEMAQTINDFKTAYGVNTESIVTMRTQQQTSQNSNSSQEQDENELQHKTQQQSTQKTTFNEKKIKDYSRKQHDRQKQQLYSNTTIIVSNHKQQSKQKNKQTSSQNSPTAKTRDQIQPRAGRPRALKVINKKSQHRSKQSQQYKGQEEVDEDDLDRTMVNSDDEQTFRPASVIHTQKEAHNQQRFFEKDNKVIKRVDLKYGRKKQQQDRDEQQMNKKAQKAENVQYLIELEKRSRDNLRRAAQYQQQSTQQHHQRSTNEDRGRPYNQQRHKARASNNFSQPPASRGYKPYENQDKNELEDSGKFDCRYFTAISPTVDSGAAMNSYRSYRRTSQDERNYLVSCLKPINKNGLNKADQRQQSPPSSASQKVATASHSNCLRPYDDFKTHSGKYERRNNKNSSSLRAKSSNSRHHNEVEEQRSRQQKNQQSFKKFGEIMSPSSKSNRNTSTLQQQDGLSHRSRTRSRSQLRNRKPLDLNIEPSINCQIQDSTNIQQQNSKAYKDNRNSAANNVTRTPQCGIQHSTQRSMGIESYYQHQTATIQHDEEEDLHSETNKQGSISSPTEYNHHETQQYAMKQNQETINLLKKQISEKDQTIQMLRDELCLEKKRNEDLLQANIELEKQKQEVEDQQTLYAKYKALLHVNLALEERISTQEQSSIAQQTNQNLFQQSYEALKVGQIELVDMNKNLIMKHQEESKQMQEQIRVLRKELDSKIEKLQRYTEVIKSFDSQIYIFEDFQKSTIEEMNKLKSQVRLFQELFQKEKTVNCELTRQLQPFINAQNKIFQSHDSYSGGGGFDSQKGSMMVTDSIGMSAAGASSLNERRNSGEPTKLTQTMSKNLSFGKPLFNGSNQSIKNRNQRRSPPQDRKNSHLLDLPLQILSETSSDDAKYTGGGDRQRIHLQNAKICEAFEQFQKQSQIGQQLLKHEEEQQQVTTTVVNQDFPPPQPRRQDSSMGRPSTAQQQNYNNLSQNDTSAINEQDMSYISAISNRRNFENYTSVLTNYQTPLEVAEQQQRNYHQQNLDQSTWNSRTLDCRISNQRLVEGCQQRNSQNSRMNKGEKMPKNISQDVIALFNNADIQQKSADLDVSGYSITTNLSRIDKKKHGMIEESKLESIDSQKEASEIASQIIKQRQLQFKKPRPVSENSGRVAMVQAAAQQYQGAIAGNTNSAQTNKFRDHVSDIRTKLQDKIVSRDYYTKLRMMQNRLEKAKLDIKENVSRSRSRSKSPAMMEMQAQQQNQQQSDYPQVTPENYMIRQRTVSSQKSSHSQINNNNLNCSNRSQPRASTNNLPAASNPLFDTNAAQDFRRDSYRHMPQKKSTKGRVLNNNQLKNTNTSATNSSGYQQNQLSQNNLHGQQPASLFYTSLYNGVQLAAQKQ